MRSIILHISIYLFATGFLYAQEADDLLSKKNTEDLKLQLDAVPVTDVDQTISLGDFLYKTAYGLEDPYMMIHALRRISSAKMSLGQVNSAIEYIDRAIEIGEQYKVDQNTLVAAIQLKGNHFFDSERYEKATNTYYEALKIAKSINDNSAIWALNTNLGFIKLRSGDPLNALKDLKISDNELGTQDIERKKYVPALLKARISEAYLKLNQLDSALILNDRGLELSNFTEAINIRIDLLMHKGLIYLRKDDLENALNFLIQAKNLSYSANDKIFLGKIYNLIAEVYLQNDDNQKAVTVLEESLKTLDLQFENSEQINICYKLLAQAYRKIGNLEMATEYFNQHILSSSQLNLKKKNANTKINDQTLASFQNKLNALQTAKSKQQSSLLFTQIVLIALGSILILTFYFYKRNNKKSSYEFSLSNSSHTDRVTDQEQILSAPDVKKEQLTLSDTKRNEIIEGFKKLIRQEYYLKKDCSLYTVSKKIGTNTSYLSKAINKEYHKSFNQIVNELRIQYTLKMLTNDDKFRAYSIKSISEEVGYKSADSFSKYFKKETGLLPSTFIKNLES